MEGGIFSLVCVLMFGIAAIVFCCLWVRERDYRKCPLQGIETRSSGHNYSGVGGLTTSVWRGQSHPMRLSLSSFGDLKRSVDDYSPLPNGKDKWGNDVRHSDEVFMKICCQLALQAVSKGNFGIGVVMVDTKGDLKRMLNGAYLNNDGQVGEGKVLYSEFIGNALKMLDRTYVDSSHPDRGLLDQIVAVGQNQLFYQGITVPASAHVRSDRHGEMVALDLLEDAMASVPGQESFQTKMPDGVVLYTQLESCPQCLSRCASSSISAVLYGAPDNGGGMAHLICNLPPVFQDLVSYQVHAPAKVSGDVSNPLAVNHLVGLCLNSFGITVAEVGSKQSNRACSKCPDNDGLCCPSYPYCRPSHGKDMMDRAAFDLSGYVR